MRIDAGQAKEGYDVGGLGEGRRGKVPHGRTGMFLGEADDDEVRAKVREHRMTMTCHTDITFFFGMLHFNRTVRCSCR